MAASQKFISRGFFGKRREPQVAKANRIPPGQYLTPDFPVLSAGPTSRIPLDKWEFAIEGLVKEPVKWTWGLFTTEFLTESGVKVIRWVTYGTRSTSRSARQSERDQALGH